jgi:predicted amidohydrolase YtcJ
LILSDIFGRPYHSEASQLIDLKGKAILPGLIDVHVRLMATTINRTQIMARAHESGRVAGTPHCRGHAAAGLYYP